MQNVLLGKVKAVEEEAMNASAQGQKKRGNRTGKTTVICLHCGKSFEVYICHLHRGQGKFCSMKCKGEHKTATGNETRTCFACGNNFTVIKSSSQRFCSSTCMGVASRTRTETKCLNCGANFVTTPARVKNGGGKCCSRKCWDAYKRQPHPTLHCKECGNEFQVYPSQGNKQFCSKECELGWKHHHSVYAATKKCAYCGQEFNPTSKRRKNRFCSTKCGRAWQKEAYVGRFVGELSPVYSRVAATCPNCGTDFTVKKSQDKRCKDNCCSKKCAKEWASKSGKFALENNASWLGGISFEPYPVTWNFRLREAIRNRDGRVCKLCGKSEADNGERLTVHHIDYDKHHITSDNLVALCHLCHIKTNSNRKQWTKLFLSHSHDGDWVAPFKS